MFESLERLVDKFRRSEGARPHVLTRIDDSRFDGGVELGQTFEPDEDYFTVRLNEMLLHYGAVSKPPFFSKINLWNHGRRLRRMGIRVTVARVPVIDP